MVALRLDRRLAGRVDASDVIQEAAIVAVRELPNYLLKPDLPFFVWLRTLVGQAICLHHRTHLGVKSRDAGREVRIYDGPVPGASSAALAAQLLGRDTRPSVAAARAERGSGCSRRPTPSTRSTARSWSCGTSRSFPPARPPRRWGSSDRRRASAISARSGVSRA